MTIPATKQSPLLGAILALAASTTLAGCRDPRLGPTLTLGGDTTLWNRMIAAEDARGRMAGGIAPLREGLVSSDPEIRRWAVRALGRLEQASLAATIARALEDADAGVRAEAANALAQSIVRVGDEREPADRQVVDERDDPVSTSAVASVRTTLLEQAARESDAFARTVIAESLGRLRHDAAQTRQTADTLLSLADMSEDGPHAPPQLLLGVARGLFFLARQPATKGAIPETATGLLAELTRHGLVGRATRALANDSTRRQARHIRTVAAAALLAAGGATEERLTVLLEDPDPLVRREAAAGASALIGVGARRIAEAALRDSVALVRYDAVRALGRLAEDDVCARIRSAASDANDHVALLAIDLLGTRCPRRPGVSSLLDSLAALRLDGDRSLATRTLEALGRSPRSSWHRPAHALVALASADPARARLRLRPFVDHSDGFVRAYTARAAMLLGDELMLRRLARDSSPNVRTAAVDGLRVTRSHAADDVYLNQLLHDDSQLLQSAAVALEGSTRAGVVAALLTALDRISAAKSETSRDARRALLVRIGELGGARDEQRILPYLRDFDPEIAKLASDIVERWTGVRERPRPSAPPPLPLPSLAELVALDRAQVFIEMAGGGTIQLRLRPFDAPTNTARFARLARQGYYNGLTFHRVAPNFVVQGGSPGANEYAGDGPYTRDELGLLSNWRGTVGLSTRGRDTGDAQLYINLIDNVRLDHDYTVWAVVVSGMDVVDRMLEGAVMRRVTVR